MERTRLLELLAYAKVCFDKCTNPFEWIHLSKKKVSADECRDLSFKIAEIIEEDMEALMGFDQERLKGFLEQAERDFAETQT